MDRDPSLEHTIECARAILQLTEEALVLMRDELTAVVAGAKTVTVDDFRRLAERCDQVIAQARTVRRQTDRWLGIDEPSSTSTRVM